MLGYHSAIANKIKNVLILQGGVSLGTFGCGLMLIGWPI
jgi:hypothetical protein